MKSSFHIAVTGMALVFLSSVLLSGCFAKKNMDTTGLFPVAQNGQVVVAQTTTVRVSGGSSPYTYALISGGGSVSAAGVYSAPTAIGVATVRVMDSEGNITTAQITIVADSPAQIAISAPYSMGYSTCSTAFGVTSQDSYGNASSVASNTSVTLASTGSAAFYTDSSCSTSAGGVVTIVAGSSSQNFYMKNSVYELNTVTLSASGLTAPAGWKLSVLPSTLGGGRTHTCVVVNDASKSLKCWGKNGSSSLLGDGTTVSQISPSAGNGLTGMTTFSGQETGSCALQASGGVKCWGANNNGQVGDGTTTTRTTPTSVDTSIISSALMIAGGVRSNYALLQNGAVYAWGNNADGGLGDGSTTNRVTPVAVSGISTAISIGASNANNYSCAVLSDNTAKCWGKNDYKQLGDNTSTNSSVPVGVLGVANAKAIAPGFRHTCALLTDGTVKCWGTDADGQIGDGAPTGTHGTPTAVSGLTNAVQISSGSYHTCAVITGGTLKCWGSNAYGQLGDGTLVDRTSPITVPGITTAISVSAMWYSTCATLSDQSMQCWGAHGGTSRNRGLISSNPLGVTTVTAPGVGLGIKDLDITAIASGEYFSCGLLTNGTAKCWGCGPSGELGYNSTTCTTSPVTVKITGGVTDLASITQLATASGNSLHACALVGGGSPAVMCWGENGNRQLGDGTTTDRSVATSVGGGGITNATHLGLAYTYSCAVLSTGGVKCWGNNSSGLLADGSTTLSATPAAVTGFPTGGAVNANQVAAANLATCVLLNDGTAQCWGLNTSGQLGDGTTTSRNSVAAVSGLSGASQIVAGYSHFCALVTGGYVKCWGNNSSGQLGDGTTTNRTTSVTVTGISGATAISAGTQHSCATFTDGSAKCWGSNLVGHLGDGTDVDTSTPVSLYGVTGAVSVSASTFQTCAIFGNGDAQCAGYNPHSQLGLGTTALINPHAVSGL